MKHLFYLTLIFMSLQSCKKEEGVKAPVEASTPNSILATTSWERKADFGGVARINAISFTIGNKGYMGGGSLHADFWEFDPETDEWTKKADLPGKNRLTPFAFAIRSKAYVARRVRCPGGKKPFAMHFYEYQPETDTWLRKADYPGSTEFGVASFSTEHFGYVGCGSLGYYDPEEVEQYHYDFSEKKEFWKYNPQTNKWSRIADFGGGNRSAGVGFSIGNKGYVGFGNSTSPEFEPHKDLWEYNEVQNTWTRMADFTGSARVTPVAFGLNNKGYIATGQNYMQRYLNDFWEFDPSSNSWTRKSDFPGTIRNFASGFALNGKGYLGLGAEYTTAEKDFWEYSPED